MTSNELNGAAAACAKHLSAAEHHEHLARTTREEPDAARAHDEKANSHRSAIRSILISVKGELSPHALVDWLDHHGINGPAASELLRDQKWPAGKKETGKKALKVAAIVGGAVVALFIWHQWVERAGVEIAGLAALGAWYLWTLIRKG